MELSKEELLFSSEGGVDSVTVTTDRNSWLAHPLISVGVPHGNSYYLYEEGFGFSNYPHIKDPWFNINVIDGKKIIFSVSRNESGKDRSSSVTLDPGNCGSGIKVIQSAE